MELKELLNAQRAGQPSNPTWTPDWQVDVAEMVARWMDDQDRCIQLDDGDSDFMTAVFWELVDDPKWRATPHILEHIRSINRRIRHFG